ncbi:hypothetical protein SDIAM103S_02013 [Streptomyces diastaticus subsp. diastaticus]
MDNSPHVRLFAGLRQVRGDGRCGRGHGPSGLGARRGRDALVAASWPPAPHEERLRGTPSKHRSAARTAALEALRRGGWEAPGPSPRGPAAPLDGPCRGCGAARSARPVQGPQAGRRRAAYGQCAPRPQADPAIARRAADGPGHRPGQPLTRRRPGARGGQVHRRPHLRPPPPPARGLGGLLLDAFLKDPEAGHPWALPVGSAGAARPVRRCADASTPGTPVRPALSPCTGGNRWRRQPVATTAGGAIPPRGGERRVTRPASSGHASR